MFPSCSLCAIALIMLIALSIRDFILVRSLDLELANTHQTAIDALIAYSNDEPFSRVDGEGEPELPDTDQTRFGTRS